MVQIKVCLWGHGEQSDEQPVVGDFVFCDLTPSDHQ